MKRVKEVSIYDLMSWDNSVNINIESLLNIWNNSDFTAWLGNDGYVYITDRKVEPKNDYIFKCEKEEAVLEICTMFQELGLMEEEEEFEEYDLKWHKDSFGDWYVDLNNKEV